MKKNLSALALVIGLSVPFAAKMQSQVRIGDGVAPTPGAILDLNKNRENPASYEGGLLLPVVDILDMEFIPPTFTDYEDIEGTHVAGKGVDANADLTGMIVYNTRVETGKGVYMWDGEKWKPMGRTEEPREECVDCLTGGNITTYVNVMYDFQHQELEAYDVPDATDHLWQVSTDNFASNIKHLPGNGAKFNVPEDFIHDYDAADLTDDKLYFRCLVTNANGTRVKTPVFEMLFIRTTEGGAGTAYREGEGYGEEGGVKYLTIQKGEVVNGIGTVKGGTIKIALLNLGQGGTGAFVNGVQVRPEDADAHLNDAADLGDIYQWGRVADGHEHITWIKDDENHVNTFDVANSSATVPYATNTMPSYDADHQVSSSTHFGKFITTDNAVANGNLDWYYDGGHDNSLWGNGGLSRTTRESDITLSGWVNPQNSPCPTGWYVPSSWNFWDTYKGNGTDTSMSNSSYDGSDNTWSWRGVTYKACGGAIITNDNGGKVFLPVSGIRSNGDGELLHAVGTMGGYWASTYYSTATTGTSPGIAYALSMTFSSSTVYAGNTNALKSHGMSVRCVAEVPAP